ncbi:MAG: xanthine dehydrogenase family protein molybdopterin-binding subunit [Aigarchaeota archaeon]|nr:xanthine dehydrogenase family protein molybdopterin-binding subunit [Aigarchaeota archaeon]
MNKGESQIGKPIPDIDSEMKVRGKAIYAFDFELPGMLYAKLVTSIHSHARLVSVDTSEALKVPGVVTVATGKDFPYMLGIYVGDREILAIDKVRWVGSPVAAIVATSLEAAEKAMDLVEVEYDPLPSVYDPMEAVRPDAPVLHEKLGEYRRSSAFYPRPGTNIANEFKIKKGDVEKGFRGADLIVDETFKMPYVSQMFTETQSTVAHYHEDGFIEVWSSAQSPFAVRYLMAMSLGVPVGRICVYHPYIGGGFGGKAGLAWEPLVSLLSKKAGCRPVKLVLTRKEQFTVAAVREGFLAELKVGVKKDGRLTAWKARFILDSGAYGDYTVNVTRAAGYSCTGAYYVPNIHAQSLAVYTNKVPTTAFRGFGHFESHWAAERMMDIIAEKLKMDPVELRARNLLKAGLTTATGEVLPKDSGDPEQCLRTAAEAIKWGEPLPKAKEPWKLRGRGIAVGMKGPAQPSNAASSAVIKLNEDSSVDLLVGTGSLGQGTTTSLCQIVADGLGLPLEKIRVRPMRSTDTVAYTWQTVGSRGLFSDGNAAMAAVQDLKNKMKEVVAQALRAPTAILEVADGHVFVNVKPERNVAFSDLVLGYTYPNGNAIGGPLIGVGTYIATGNTNLDPETGQGIPTVFHTFGATACTVEVDVSTGQVRVEEVVQAFDIGKAINPQLVIGQMDGGCIMGHSLALYEEMIFDDRGWVLNPNLSTYYVLRAKDMAREIKEIIIENPQSDGPHGARGIGENVMLAVAPAIANAIQNATGIRMMNLPMTPENIWKAIKEQRPDLLEHAKRGLMED